MRAINDDEKRLFACIRQFNGQYLGLVSTELQGIETACICWIEQQETKVAIQPLAILVNDEIFPMLTEPGTE